MPLASCGGGDNKVRVGIAAPDVTHGWVAAVAYYAETYCKNEGVKYKITTSAGAVVGGTAMSGGRGSIVGAFLGMLVIGAMNNVLNMLGVPTYLCDAVRGAIIIVAVLVQRRGKKDV